MYTFNEKFGINHIVGALENEVIVIYFPSQRPH